MIKNTILTALLVGILAGCGGGSSDAPQPLYGAIAINPNSVLTMGITSDQATENDAIFRAEINCGSGCKVQRVFVTPNKCGAIAYDLQRISAWGVGATSNEAENAALLSCRNGGGNFCSLYASRCNTQ